MSEETSGGFFGRLSPPVSPQASPSTVAATLPHSREHPLKTGGSKESTFIRFVDQNLLKIQRRYAKRGESDVERQNDTPDGIGYRSFAEAARDIEKLVDLIWVSGTPSLQIPYLLTIAMLVEQYLSGFPPSPRATFRLLGKLDLAFASLLEGRHIETGESLPGFETGKGVSATEKVRMKSIVDQTRVCVVEVISNYEGEIEEDAVEDETEDETDLDDDFGGNIDEDDDYEMGIAKVYDKTISELGRTIGGTPIGIITED